MRNAKAALLTVLAVAATLAALWLTNGAVTPKEATREDVAAEAETGGYRLITTADLWKRFREEPGSLLLVDTRQGWEYRTGHIKGALNFPMEPTWYARWRKKGALEKFLGTDKLRTIVFY